MTPEVETEIINIRRQVPLLHLLRYLARISSFYSGQQPELKKAERLAMELLGLSKNPCKRQLIGSSATISDGGVLAPTAEVWRIDTRTGPG